MGTDLDRDEPAARLKPLVIRVVHLVSTDGTWSAMGFGPDLKLSSLVSEELPVQPHR